MRRPGIITIPERADEVTLAEYNTAISRLRDAAAILPTRTPDEAAEHWLPSITEYIAVIFAYVGANMTARNVGVFMATQHALALAKDVQSSPPAGSLPENPLKEGSDGSIRPAGS